MYGLEMKRYERYETGVIAVYEWETGVVDVFEWRPVAVSITTCILF